MQVQNTGLARRQAPASHAGQALASGRKKANKLARDAANKAEAATLGISVSELLTRRAQEVDAMRARTPTIRGHVGPPPPEQVRADDERMKGGRRKH